MRVCASLPASFARRACLALQRMEPTNAYPWVWQLTQEIRATLNARARLAVRQRYAKAVYRMFRAYFDGHPFSHGATAAVDTAHQPRYYDDNDWIGMDLLSAYRQSGLKPLLEAVEGIQRFIYTGQWRSSDPPDDHFDPGGVYWNTHRRQRTLDTNGGATQMALSLYLLTHRMKAYRHSASKELDFAKAVYRWVRRTLAMANGLYHASVAPGGIITGGAAINGDAMMVRDGLMLYHITGFASYRKDALKTAAAISKQYPVTAIEKMCPVYVAQSFYDLGSSVLHRLQRYANWVVAHMNHRGVLLKTRYPSHCTGPNPQSGATGALILRLRSTEG
jgi:Glycosyl hydrolase family 76